MTQIIVVYVLIGTENWTQSLLHAGQVLCIKPPPQQLGFFGNVSFYI